MYLYFTFRLDRSLTLQRLDRSLTLQRTKDQKQHFPNKCFISNYKLGLAYKNRNVAYTKSPVKLN